MRQNGNFTSPRPRKNANLGGMKCPFCKHTESRVVESRVSQGENVTRRRRECLDCQRRFTTYERLEELWPAVVKKDGRREAYDREKIRFGLKLACQKRPITSDTLERVLELVESRILAKGAREVESIQIGQWVMDELRDLDKVAYIRFASVYREFQDVEAFVNELRQSGISVNHGSNSDLTP